MLASVLFAALCIASPPAADVPIVAGHVVFASVVRIEERAAELYAALGMDGLFDPAWIAADFAAGWPANDLTGLDRTAPVGRVLLVDSVGRVSAAPFARIVDARGFESALAAAGWKRDPGSTERIVGADARERFLVTLASGETAVAADAGEADVLRALRLPADLAAGAAPCDARVHLDVAAALPRVLPVVRTAVDLAISWSRMKEMMSLSARPADPEHPRVAPSEILARCVPPALALVGDWRAFDCDVTLGPDAVTIRAEVAMQPRSKSAEFVRTLVDDSLPELVPPPEGARLAIASTGDGAALADLLAASGVCAAASPLPTALRASAGGIYLVVPGANAAERPWALDLPRPAGTIRAAGTFAAAIGPLLGSADGCESDAPVVSGVVHANGETLRANLRLAHADLRRLVPNARVK